MPEPTKPSTCSRDSIGKHVRDGSCRFSEDHLEEAQLSRMVYEAYELAALDKLASKRTTLTLRDS